MIFKKTYRKVNLNECRISLKCAMKILILPVFYLNSLNIILLSGSYFNDKLNYILITDNRKLFLFVRLINKINMKLLN